MELYLPMPIRKNLKTFENYFCFLTLEGNICLNERKHRSNMPFGRNKKCDRRHHKCKNGPYSNCLTNVNLNAIYIRTC